MRLPAVDGVIVEHRRDDEDDERVDGEVVRIDERRDEEEQRDLEEPNVLEGESRVMSVLFADIQGFRQLSEGLSAPELKRVLNEFFTPLTRVILAVVPVVLRERDDACEEDQERIARCARVERSADHRAEERGQEDRQRVEQAREETARKAWVEE